MTVGGVGGEVPHSAVVVGAGIGGLTAAHALRAVGWQVTVLERAPVLAEVGAGLSLWPNATRALGWLGLEEQVRARGVATVSRGNFRRPDGRWLRRARPDDVGVLAMHRADLHEVLLSALPEGVVRTGATVAGVTDADRGATVTYVTDERHEMTADLVVAADGINSVVRGQHWPRHPAPVFQHRTVWRGVTPAGAVPAAVDCLTLDRGQQFGVLPLAGERAYWFLTANADEPDAHYPDERAEVLRRIAGWHYSAREVVEATDPDHVLHNDVVDLDPLPTFVAQRIVLLGDAAHAMTPDLGQGACQAIEDAVVLAHQVATTVELPTALAGYDAQRRGRAQQVAAASRQSCLRNADDGAVGHAVRTAALRVLPPGAWRRATARWSDWTPPDVGAVPTPG